MDLQPVHREGSGRSLRSAQTLAARLSHQHVDNEHLLVALLEQEQGIAPNILLPSAASIWRKLHRRLMSELERQSKVTASSGASGMYLTQRLAAVLGNAEQEAKRMRDDLISVEHRCWPCRRATAWPGSFSATTA